MKPVVLVALLSVFLFLHAPAYSGTIRVPDDYPNIQDAINAAVNGDTIEVAPGTYVENIDFLGKAIVVRSDEGPEVTVIDGGNPVVPDQGSVVTFTNGEGPDSVIDGFYITNGSGTGPSAYFDRYGGGVLCDNHASPTISNNIIAFNYADGSGGIHCATSGDPVISCNSITDNKSYHHSGGGIVCGSNSCAVITGNVIARNQAMDRDGGGIVCWNASLLIDNNIIEENIALGEGGGILCSGGMTPVITNNRITGNKAYWGAGINSGLHTGGSVTISGNIITDNEASHAGGGILSSSDKESTISNNIIANNHAGFQGGGIYSSGVQVMVNNTIYGNSAEVRGGGVSCEEGPSTVVNSILWDNSAPLGREVYLGYVIPLPSVLHIRYSLLEGGGDSVYVEPGCILNVGPGMIDSNPLFADPANGYFYLQQDPCQPGVSNPCVDAGAPGSTMIDGSTRMDGVPDSAIMDLGYHYPTGNSLVVPDAFPLIQDAIDASSDGNVVFVRPGTYVENIDFTGKAILVRSEQGPETTVIDGNQSGSVVTFKNGECKRSVLQGFCVTNGSGQGASYGGGVFCESSSPTITGNIIARSTAENGGGIYCYLASPLITDNLIARNRATTGAGMYCYFSSPVIEDNRVRKNQADLQGAGILCRESSPRISKNTVSENFSDSTAGGISMAACSPTFTDNVVSGNVAEWLAGGIELRAIYSGTISGNVVSGNSAIGNSASKGGYGGGLYCSRITLTMANNVIFSNSSKDVGGAIYCMDNCDLEIINGTIFDNVSDEGGGGFYCRGSSITIANTIMWANKAPQGREGYLNDYYGLPSTFQASFSALRGGQSAIHVEPGCTLHWGSGMIDVDPRFVEPAAGDLHLRFDSPCKDVGDGTVPDLPSLDIEGDPRIAGSDVDMGADEFHPHLYHLGSVQPGNLISIRVLGTPAAPVVLALGEGIQDPPQSTIYGDLFLGWPIQHFPLGAIPSEGVLLVNTLVPGSWTAGEERPLQALIGPFGNPSSLLTNLLNLTVE